MTILYVEKDEPSAESKQVKQFKILYDISLTPGTWLARLVTVFPKNAANLQVIISRDNRRQWIIIYLWGQ